MHSIDFSEYFPLFARFIRKIVEYIENKLVSKVDSVLTVDSVNGFLLRRYRQYNNHVKVLYNTPELRSLANSETLEKLKADYQCKRVLAYIGGIMERKGLMKSLEALNLVKDKIPNIELLLIGSLKDSKNRALEYLKKYNIQKNVKIIDWLPYKEMLCYLKVAEIGLALHQPVGIYKLVSKGSGRKFFTYMQAGVPIVGPDFGEVGRVVREEKCGVLVDTTDAYQIADAIIYLLEHLGEAKTMGERGRKAIEEKYNWEIEKKKLLGDYRRLEGEIREQKSRV
jgi:glycosyltransferase involved in cell wall biosynthesis